MPATTKGAGPIPEQETISRPRMAHYPVSRMQMPRRANTFLAGAYYAAFNEYSAGRCRRHTCALLAHEKKVRARARAPRIWTLSTNGGAPRWFKGRERRRIRERPSVRYTCTPSPRRGIFRPTANEIFIGPYARAGTRGPSSLLYWELMLEREGGSFFFGFMGGVCFDEAEN